MSDVEMEHERGSTDRLHDLVESKMKTAFAKQKEELLREMGSLFEKISESSNSSQLNKLNSLLVSDTPKFKRKSNEEQFRFNAKVSNKLNDVEQSIELNSAQALDKLTEAKDMIAHRQKLIRMADSNELGWRMVHEYESNPLADDSDDERRMYKAEARASKKLKAERTKKTKQYRATPYRRTESQPSATSTSTATSSVTKPGLCFLCGKAGHWRKECPGSSNNKMSINSFSYSLIKDKEENSLEKEPEQAEIPPIYSPVGRLKAMASRWKSANASAYIYDVVCSGYKIPFKTSPNSEFLKNNKSARDNPQFVGEEIKSLLMKGVISLTKEKPYVVNPLTVAYSRKGKPRLVLDCRHINKHLHLFNIKFEDVKVAESLFGKGSYLFTFDLKSAYHHIDIFPDHRTYLGFSWTVHGKTSFYVYNSLPFGISSAGHIFTKVTRVVVAYIRSQGIKIAMFLDDGIGGSENLQESLFASNFTRSTLLEFGFLIADEKCTWQPSHKVTWLGHVFDFILNRLFITEERICRLLKSIDSILDIIYLDQFNLIQVRKLASVIGQIISLYTVFGNRVRYKTRESYNCILSRASWNSPVIVSSKALDELRYWKNSVKSLNEVGKPLQELVLHDYLLYSDASSVGYGGYIVKNGLFRESALSAYSPQVAGSTADIVPLHWLPEVSASFDEVSSMSEGCKSPGFEHRLAEESEVHDYRNTIQECSLYVIGCWDENEKVKSSTWRETEAVSRIIKSHGQVLRNCSVKIYTDNKNVCSVLLNGSGKKDLQKIAISVNAFCDLNGIKFSPEWVPREKNQLADHLSRCFDSDDWSVSNEIFAWLDSVWGKHTIDRFSSHYNNKCVRFNSKWWVPETEGINAFHQCWKEENNWIVPPPRLVANCLKKLEIDKAKGTLITPKWSSAPFWPLLCERDGKFKKFVKDVRYLPRKGSIRIGKGNNGLDLTKYLESQKATAGIHSGDDTSEHMARYLLNSHADSTVKKYSGYFKVFSQFCVKHSLSAKPAEPMVVATFLTNMLDDNKTYSVISAIVYSIKWIHSLHGLSDPTNNSIVQNLLLAAKRLRSKPTNKKDLIDSDVLIELCNRFKNDMTLVNLRDLSMIFICYSGFLRFNEMSSLLCSDVRFDDIHLVLKVRKSKTDIYRQGKEVLIARGKTVACPYNMLQKYMSSAGLSVSEDSYLFRPMLKSKGKYALINENKPLSYTRAKECIISKLKMVAPGLKLGTHSLRASGATCAANVEGISDRCLKKHGRWKTDTAKDGYIADSLEKRLMVSKSLDL